RPIPHISFVWYENVDYLRKRYEALQKCHLFSGMQYSEDPDELNDWIPLIMKGRSKSERVAATKMDLGTDVNFGTLTRCMFNRLKNLENVKLCFNHEVVTLKQDKNGYWHVKVKDIATHKTREVVTTFVFIGAGGGSLPLLLKSH